MMVISKSKLKPRMLEIFRTVEQTKEPLIVTDRGTPVLEIKAISNAPSTQSILASLRAGGRLDDVPGESAVDPVPAEDWEISEFPND